MYIKLQTFVLSIDKHTSLMKMLYFKYWSWF